MLSCPPPREAQVRGRAILELHPGCRKIEDTLLIDNDRLRQVDSNKTTVSRRYHVSNDDEVVEEELCLHDNVIVLTEGKVGMNKAMKTFTLPEGRNDVFWARYCTEDIKSRTVLKLRNAKQPDFKHIKCISALNANSKLLYTYSNDGEDYVTHMPFDVQKIWPTDKGILLERQLPRDSKMPRIFSLFHPLDELAPVEIISLHRKAPYHEGSQICFSSELSDFVLIYNSRDRTHSICRFRVSNTSEVQGNLKIKDLSVPRIQSPAFFSSTPVVSPANQSTPAMSYPLRSRLSDTPKSKSIQSPVLIRVQKATPLKNVTPMKTPNRSSLFSLTNTSPDPLGSSFSVPFNRTTTSSSMLSRLNANITVIVEPVLPDLMLEVIFTDKLISSVPADKVRLVQDLLKQEYLAYISIPQRKLRILKLCDGDFVFAGEIAAYDFEYIESLQMMLVMTSADGNLILYSGLTMLCPVRAESLTPAQFAAPTSAPVGRRSRSSASNLTESSRPQNIAFNLKSAGANLVYINDVRKDKEYVLTFPRHDYGEAVTSCLNGLEHLLQPDMMMVIRHKWFLQRSYTMDECGCTIRELQLFLRLILQLIGFEHEAESVSRHKRLKPETEDDDSNWEFLLTFRTFPTSNTNLKFSPNVLSAMSYHVLSALHIVYEELKTSSIMEIHCSVMASFLGRLSTAMALPNYREFYAKDFPDSKLTRTHRNPERGLKDLQIPHFFESEPPSIVKYILEALAGNSSGTAFPCLAGVSKSIQSTIQVFGTLIENAEMSYKQLPSSRIFVSRNANLEEVLSAPDLSKFNSRLAYRFIFSNLIMNLANRSTHDFSPELYTLLGRGDLAAQVTQYRSSKTHWFIPTPTETTKGGEGFENLFHSMLSLRFDDDTRIKEVCSMLSTSSPVTINLRQGADVLDHDFAEEQERCLYSLCIRTLALPLGRGMLTLFSVHPVISEPIVIAHCNLTGRLGPKGMAVELKSIDTPLNMTHWPLFHNGVAAGLRVARHSKNVTSSWIAFNESYQEMNSEANNNGGMLEFGGFMLGLGLGGHLANLNPVFICELLRKRNAIMSAGVLLGLGASKRGSMSQEATNLIAIHIDALLPATSTELDVSAECRVAAISALGLLYLGSGHYHMSDVLLSEIGRPPGPEMEHSVDRESHSLSAGIALGMVMLCKGESTSQAIQTKISNALYKHMVGGPSQFDVTRFYRSPSYQIREGDQINISVTSPGATLALGLIYHRTENLNMASLMNVPETQYLLDTVQPDYLLLRTLSKGLIMWSQVAPTKEWVESHLTKFISENAFKRPAEEIPYDTVDYEGATQAYCNTLAGACFVLGLKYAGSSDQAAFRTLLHYVMMFYDIQKQPAAEQAGKNTIETSLLVCLLASSLVMAGTGDLRILRLCRVLRKRIGQGTNCVFYGSHMMIHMAIGFLFLGGGTLTLSTKPEAIAALVCALYPKFPTHFSDNRYHLQALRHLYVLAVEPRLFVCQDVVSDKLVKASITVNFKNAADSERLVAPCNLPDLDQIESVIVDDERYWRIEFSSKNFDLLRDALEKRSLIHVKQKAGTMSYVDDPKGYKTALAQCHIKDAVRGRTSERKLVHLESFSNTPIVARFVENMLSVSGKRDQMQEKLCTVVMECAAAEQLEMLSILTELMSLRVDSNSTFNLQQLKLIRDFMAYARSRRISVCGEDVILGILDDVEKKIRIDGAEFEVWYGRKSDSLPRSLPSLFLQLRGGDVSLESIVKLYKSISESG
ncbi:anaphase-promoting complex subunit 1 [Galendromus occidentalis]|uniref:Anaphase-promoting complex subunit 1 n=1 Tax=Galendromus occidentalis TaxID=34638 RepID=A0AAJ6QWP6_9ACAR|nr:anaphase-promoting complex subunit 1 [Galendromus occidentalis]